MTPHGPVRGLVVALVTVLATSGLAACSGERSYCASLKEDRPKLQKLSEDGADGLTKSIDLLAGLRDQAPDQISDEWKTLVAALQDLVAAVRASGADFSDFKDGKAPAGVTAGQLKAVQQAATELTQPRVEQAGKSIEQHAIDVCKVDLGGGLGGPAA